MSDAPAAPADDLLPRLVDQIRASGPLSVARFMAEALYDPRAGYYATKDPIGAGGDFITAPEVSQMFGELIGLFCVQSWMDMGRPSPIRLIELGPGRGAMMADMLRAARIAPAFLNAVRVELVETSPALQAAQAQTLASAPVSANWVPLQAVTLGDGPRLIIGNEFLDCLPIRQFVRADGEWRERRVTVREGRADALMFTLDRAPLGSADLALIPVALQEADDGALYEVNLATSTLIEDVAKALSRAPGRALFIDYGPAAHALGDTLQAVKAHEKVAPLEAPGRADLTARVNFAAMKETAERAGAACSGPIAQGAFLGALGLEARAAALIRAGADRTTTARQILRLTDAAEMGALFKAIALSSPNLPPPPGF